MLFHLGNLNIMWFMIKETEQKGETLTGVDKEEIEGDFYVQITNGIILEILPKFYLTHL